MHQDSHRGKPLFQTSEEEAVLIEKTITDLAREFPGYRFSGRVHNGAYHVDVIRTVSGDSLSEICGLIRRNLA